MKFFLSSILLVFLCSCRKENTNLGPDYPHLVGKWENIGPSDDRIHVEFYKSGLIKISKSTERMKNFRVDDFEFIPPGTNRVLFFKKGKTSSFNNHNYFEVVLSNSVFNNYDTIDMFIGEYIYEFNNSSENIPRFKKIQ